MCLPCRNRKPKHLNMQQKELKIPLSCRVKPGLKEDLEEEAYYDGLTTSLYLEQILQNRNEPAEPSEEMENAAEELRELQEYSEDLKLQINNLNAEKAELEKQLSQASDETARLNDRASNLEKEVQPFRNLGIANLTPENLAEIEDYFTTFEGKYPDFPREQLLLAALNQTMKNEKSFFFIHTLQGYFNNGAA
jgi:predicted nuclease with TOPRIM domain